MPSSADYLNFVLEQLSDLDGISYRAMMGEYIIYYNDKIIGGIYDNRFLVKPTKSVLERVGEPRYEIPYPGAKEMILMDVDDRPLLASVVKAMYSELPAVKKRKSK